MPGPSLRIAMLAPPWIPVPAPGYGGIEAVVDSLTGELVRLGCDVTLFAAPGSTSAAAVRPVLDRAYRRAAVMSVASPGPLPRSARMWSEGPAATVR